MVYLKKLMNFLFYVMLKLVWLSSLVVVNSMSSLVPGIYIHISSSPTYSSSPLSLGSSDDDSLIFYRSLNCFIHFWINQSTYLECDCSKKKEVFFFTLNAYCSIFAPIIFLGFVVLMEGSILYWYFSKFVYLFFLNNFILGFVCVCTWNALPCF